MELNFDIFLLFCFSVINLNELDTDEIVKHLTADHIYELCTLCLYGTTVLSPRIKILLDRILDTLTQAERENILKSLKWSIDDYEKSYIEHVRIRRFFVLLFFRKMQTRCTRMNTIISSFSSIDRKESIFFTFFCLCVFLID